MLIQYDESVAGSKRALIQCGARSYHLAEHQDQHELGELRGLLLGCSQVSPACLWIVQASVRLRRTPCVHVSSSQI